MSTYIIAEAGVNHNGSPDMALGLIEAAARAGADAVKFQTFKAEKLVSRHAQKAAYQQRTTGGGESQLEMIRRLELSPADHHRLRQRCADLKIDFLSTPFDEESLDFLADELDLPCIKIPSGEITNAPFLLAIAAKGRPAILSTGMSTLDEIADALGALAFGYLGQPGTPGSAAFRQALATPAGAAMLRDRLTLLHCTTEYPAPFDEVNLRAMDTLAERFGLPVGYSDHTQGIAIPIAAAARGACLVEKHFTLDRSLPGPDHAASLEPDELAAMVESIRLVEQALGSAAKAPTPSEQKNRAVARKSLVAAQAIRRGEPLTPQNLCIKRPGSGLSPFRYWEMLGQVAARDYLPDELIEP